MKQPSPNQNQPDLDQHQSGTPADKLTTSSDIVTNGSVPTGTSGFGAKRILTSKEGITD